MSTNQDDSVSPDEEDPSLAQLVDGEDLLASVDPDTFKTVVKLLLGIGALIFLLVIASFLPGLDRLIPTTPITFASLIIALITLGIVAILLYVAPHLERLVQQGVASSRALATNAAGVVKYLIVLLAVLVAYRGLAGAIVPLMGNTNPVWAYDLSFLVLALLPTVLIARYLYRGLDPAAELVTRKVTTTAGYPTLGEAAPVGERGASEPESGEHDAAAPDGSDQSAPEDSTT